MLWILCLPAAGREWAEYRTENFRILSDAPAREVRRVLAGFEAFRQALLLVTGLSGLAVDERVRIFMYRDRRDYHALGVGKSVGGFFVRTDDGPVLVVGPERGVDSQQVLFHEYIHHLLYRHSPLNYPRWYSEGIAETFSVVAFDGRRLEFALVPPGRAQTFAFVKALPLEDLLAERGDRGGSLYWARFYATAWLLTHYLMVGDGKDAQRAALREYLVEYHAGRRDPSVFEQALGRSLREVERALWSYRRQRSWPTYTVLFPTAPEGTITVQRPDRRRVRYEKARLALQLEAPEEALRQLDGERRRGAGPVDDLPEALALRANVQHALAADDATAFPDRGLLKLMDRALREAPDSLEVQFWASRLLVFSAAADGDAVEVRDLRQPLESKARQIVLRARALAERASQQDPAHFGALKMLWYSNALLDEPVAATQAMMSAYQLRPNSTRLNLNMGRYLHALERQDLARPFLERVIDWSHSDVERSEAQALLANAQDVLQ